MAAVAALLPVLLILLLMMGLRWAAAPAGLAGLLAALAVATLGFGWTGAEGVGLGRSLAGLAAEAGFTALTILWIVFPALWLHELQLASGATATLRAALARLSADPRILALLIAWFFALFAEGAAGFGTPVALAAPILVALGFEPVRAVALALVGHAVGVSFGAVGTPVLPQIAATGLDPLALAGTTAALHLALGWTMVLFVHRLACGPGAGGAGPGWALLAGAAFLLPYGAIALLVGPELPTLGGALLGGAAFALMLRARMGPGSGATPAPRALRDAALPYLALLGMILLTRLVPPLREALSGFTWAWSLSGAFGGQVQPLYHPGTLLLLGLLAGGLARGTPARQFRDAAAIAASRLPAVLLALVAMLALARLMVHAGMVKALAAGAAAALGPAWPLLAPAVGVLGTFVTGSATASNILLTDFQRGTAEALGLPVLLMVAAQGFGAAVGNIVCPHNIVAGAATVGLAARQAGEVMRRTLPACALYAALGGAVVLVVAAR
jgi:lactate permease